MPFLPLHRICGSHLAKQYRRYLEEHDSIGSNLQVQNDCEAGTATWPAYMQGINITWLMPQGMIIKVLHQRSGLHDLGWGEHLTPQRINTDKMYEHGSNASTIIVDSGFPVMMLLVVSPRGVLRFSPSISPCEIPLSAHILRIGGKRRAVVAALNIGDECQVFLSLN